MFYKQCRAAVIHHENAIAKDVMAYQYLMWPEYVEQNREGLGGGTWCRHISLGGFAPEREILLRKEGENSFVCCFKLFEFFH